MQHVLFIHRSSVHICMSTQGLKLNDTANIRSECQVPEHLKSPRKLEKNFSHITLADSLKIVQ